MALEAVLVPALFLAHLTEPAQLLQPLRLHLVGQPFRSSHVVLGHPDTPPSSLVDLELCKHAQILYHVHTQGMHIAQHSCVSMLRTVVYCCLISAGL